jgi:hypothetical protein
MFLSCDLNLFSYILPTIVELFCLEALVKRNLVCRVVRKDPKAGESESRDLVRGGNLKQRDSPGSSARNVTPPLAAPKSNNVSPGWTKIYIRGCQCDRRDRKDVVRMPSGTDAA